VYADEPAAWNELHARFKTKRVNHSIEYVSTEADVNQAESGFSRMQPR
jgi:hypothetical protein